jgi:hypothetical protein
MADLTRTQIAAALAESVYRRSPDDQPIDPIQNLGGADVDLANISLPGLSSPAGIASKRQPLGLSTMPSRIFERDEYMFAFFRILGRQERMRDG